MSELSESIESQNLPPLLIPEGVNYNCQGCGRCCTGWSVGLTEADYARIKDVDWGSVNPDLAGKDLFIHKEQEYRSGTSLYPHFTRPRPDGSCSFLVDNLCTIHSLMGEDAKPGTCQLFPYTFVETPSATYTGVSLSSMASVRNLGRPLTEQREALEGYFERARSYVTNKALEGGSGSVNLLVEKPYSTVLLSGQTSVSWDEFLHLDKKMLEIIKAAEQSNEDIIQTLLKVEEVILLSIAMAKSGVSLSEIVSYQPSGTMGGAVSGSAHEGIMAMTYYLYLVYPSIRASYTDMWQLNNKERFGPGKIMRLFNQYGQYIGSGFSTIFLKSATVKNYGKVNLRKAIDYKVKPLPEITQEFFRRWLYLKIFSKVYFGPSFCEYSLLAGFNNLVMCFILSMIFAKGEAMLRNEDEVKLADLYEGVFRVDKESLMMNQLLPQVTVALAVAYSVPKIGRGILRTLAKGQNAGLAQ